MNVVAQAFLLQCGQLMGFLVLGWCIGRREAKAPARIADSPREFWIDVLASSVLFVCTLGIALFVHEMQAWHRVGPVQAAIGAAPWFVVVPVTSLLFDLGNYAAHRALHSRHFWRFHRWHHSPRHLYWFAGFRASIGHIVILGLPGMVILILAGLNPWVVATLGIQGLWAQLLGHANFDVGVPGLRTLLVMPQYHRIHHAEGADLHHSNYGFFWTFWDRWLGTYRDPDEVDPRYPLGLDRRERVGYGKMVFGLD